ncbi:MAG: putative DNA binding domain-containing protein [Microscillaceae bacterium]|jgi:predicted HTH transcriptional regulator|nr:putative DNA binding domain-containing protein [Microscillaceae bacterium]
MENTELNTLIDRLLQEGENEYVEFKYNNINPEMIGQKLSALANGATLHQKNFGYLVFGIQNEPIAKLGTNFSPKTEKVGNEALEHWLVQRLNPRIDVRFYEITTPENLKLVLVQVPATSGQPVRFAHDAYIRIGSITRKLNEFPEKERKLWQKPSIEFELESAMMGVSAAEIVALLDTQSIFDLLLKIPYPTNQAGVIQKLLDEKFIVQANGYFHITNLGAILFAKDLSKFENLARKVARVIKYKGKGKLNTEKDQIGQLGYASGFQRLINYVMGLLPSNELIVDAKRQEVTMYPALAIRELIANALIHQDFRERGVNVMIEIYDDRIEISNPGEPMVDTMRFIDAFQSRNELIASAMRRMGFCEEKGSGIDKVVSECEVYQLPAPDFRVSPTHTVVVMYAHKDLNEMDKSDKIRACYQHCCLLYVNNEKMTNQTLRERFKIEDKNSAIASRIIKETLAENLIKEQDPDNKSRKYASYIPFWA